MVLSYNNYRFRKLSSAFSFALCFPFLYLFFRKCLGVGFGGFTSSDFHCYFYITSMTDRFPISYWTNFLNRGFLDRWVQHCVSIVPQPANSTRTFAIYKLEKKFPFILYAFSFCLLGPFSDCLMLLYTTPEVQQYTNFPLDIALPLVPFTQTTPKISWYTNWRPKSVTEMQYDHRPLTSPG